jgi:hypothetical protein
VAASIAGVSLSHMGVAASPSMDDSDDKSKGKHKGLRAMLRKEVSK